MDKLYMILILPIVLGLCTQFSEGHADETHENSSGVERPTTTVEDIRLQLQQFRSERHHQTAGSKEKARDYIWNFFNNLPKDTGEILEKQTFTSPFVDSNNNPLEGVNIILTRPGKKFATSEDKPIIVAAHYDTMPDTPGVDDNGSGCAALLEVARAISTLQSLANYTIMFVSFDMEERIPFPNKNGGQGLTGSYVFVKSHLIPKMLTKYQITGFQGAIVLETMMNYNNTPKSQEVVTGFDTLFSTQYNEVKNNDFRGDFQTLIGRDADAHLLASLESNWQKLGNPEYKTLKLQIPSQYLPGRPSELPSYILPLVQDFFRSDHYRFWDSNHTKRGLPGVMVTDTADFRGYMMQCYHKPCDDYQAAATDDNLAFLKKTTDAVIGTLLELSGLTDYTRKTTSDQTTPDQTTAVQKTNGPVSIASSRMSVNTLLLALVIILTGFV